MRGTLSGERPRHCCSAATGYAVLMYEGLRDHYGMDVQNFKVHAYAEAESVLRESLAIRQKKQPNRWNTFNAQSMLGGALLGQKKYADAEPLLLAGYDGMKQRRQSIPPSKDALARGRRAAGATV